MINLEQSDSLFNRSRRQVLPVFCKEYANPLSEWPVRVSIRFPLDTLHNPIVLSPDPNAKYSSSPENMTLDTNPEWPMRILMHSLLDTFHNLIVLSEQIPTLNTFHLLKIQHLLPYQNDL